MRRSTHLCKSSLVMEADFKQLEEVYQALQEVIETAQQEIEMLALEAVRLSSEMQRRLEMYTAHEGSLSCWTLRANADAQYSVTVAKLRQSVLRKAARLYQMH